MFHRVSLQVYLLKICKTIINGLVQVEVIVELLIVILELQELKLEEPLVEKKRRGEEENQDQMLGSSICDDKLRQSTGAMNCH